MINHARTLLLNARPGAVGQFPGEEYVPAGFQPAPVGSALQSVRQLLFGSRPDRLMLNYRVKQLLTVVAATPLQSYLTALDARLTYDLAADASLFEHTFGISAQQLSGDTLAITLGGVPDMSVDATGLCRQKWRLTFGSPISVTVRRLTYPFDETTVGFTITDSLSSAIPLIGSGFFFKFYPLDGTLDWETLTEDEWEALDELNWESLLPDNDSGSFVANPVIDVVADVRPQRDLGQLLAGLDTLGEPTILSLFGVGTALQTTEPYATCYRLFQQHPDLPHRLGAAVTALIYQTARGNNGE